MAWTVPTQRPCCAAKEPRPTFAGSSATGSGCGPAAARTGCARATSWRSPSSSTRPPKRSTSTSRTGSSLLVGRHGRPTNNHLRRCLDLIEGLARLDDEEVLAAWLERIEDDGSDLSEPARRLLLTEFLDRGDEDAA